MFFCKWWVNHPSSDVAAPVHHKQSFFCFDELFININLHCRATKAFALLTWTLLGLKDITGCWPVVLFFVSQCREKVWLTAFPPPNCAIVWILSIQRYHFHIVKISKRKSKSLCTQHRMTKPGTSLERQLFYLLSCIFDYIYNFYFYFYFLFKAFIIIRNKTFHAWWAPTPKVWRETKIDMHS